MDAGCFVLNWLDCMPVFFFEDVKLSYPSLLLFDDFHIAINVIGYMISLHFVECTTHNKCLGRKIESCSSRA